MRDIKFRAWDKKEKRMIKKFLPDWGNINQDRYLLLQFTGLCDKNGTEIYEGDIVTDIYINGEYYTGNHEVAFIGSSFCIIIKRGINNRHDYIPCLDEAWLERIEVIGNIYENPELVKGEIKCW